MTSKVEFLPLLEFPIREQNPHLKGDLLLTVIGDKAYKLVSIRFYPTQSCRGR